MNSYTLMGSKQRSHGDKATFSQGRSYVPYMVTLQKKIVRNAGNDQNLRSEQSFVRQQKQALKIRASRIPAGILLLTLSIVPFVFDTTPLIIIAVATFGFIECFVHTMGIRLFRMKRFYTPGMVTAWLEFVVSVIMIAYLAVNDIARWYDYVFGPLLMIVCFGLLQKTMTLMVGIRYSDMPRMIRRQWTRCD